MLLDATKDTLKFLTDLPAHNAARSEILVFGSAHEWVDRLGENRSETVLTIGNFDGVHVGHQKILREVVERAAAAAADSHGAGKELLPAVLTFYPHPARVLRPQQAPSLLETVPLRLADFAAMGIGATLVLKFDADLAQESAEDFVKKYLVDTMSARAVLVGATFRFGHKQLGDVELLRELGRRWGFEVVIETVLSGGSYRSVTNVGVRPTFDGKRLAIESHLFDFAEALTSGLMKVRFLQRLRDEQKFSGPEALREQVLKDIERAQEVFAQSYIIEKKRQRDAV